jgi:hypothetical protein
VDSRSFLVLSRVATRFATISVEVASDELATHRSLSRVLMRVLEAARRSFAAMSCAWTLSSRTCA